MAFANANWIVGASSCEAPLFRRTFEAGRVSGARIEICGLGFFELYLNGTKVSEDLFVPAWSNYEPRPGRRMLYPIRDEFSYRIYYLEYDLKPYLREGTNVIGVRLGNGWYNQRERNVEGDFAYGLPKLCFSLELEEENGERRRLVSDEQTRWSRSEIVQNNIYFGETHDLSRRNDGWSGWDFDDSLWSQAHIVAAPAAPLYRQTCPADRVIRRIDPVRIWQKEGRRIYDCGENISGYAVIRTGAQSGSEIVVRHAEEYDTQNHRLNFDSTGEEKQVQTDRYLCADRSFVCHPRFCWHGFRYFEVSGDAEVLEVRVIHADVEVTSEFSCSNPTLNWLYEAYLRSQLDNLHAGVPSDCPHRERLGYTGDGQITSAAAMLCLDMHSFYRKWMEDILDCQDLVSGHVQHTAPFYGGGGGPGGWGGAIYVVPWNYYLYYGDSSLLAKSLPAILHWLDYMESRTEEGLIVREEEGGWCLGEWCAPDLQLPEPFVNTYYYIKGLRTALEANALLNGGADEAVLRDRLRYSEAAFCRAYFNKETGSFCSGVNGADAFAIDLEMGDERTPRRLAERYTALKALDTGMFGTDLIIDVLFREGYEELAFTLLIRESEHSFEKQRRTGATTLWESWTGGSHNHPMFGGVVCCLFTHILGIRQEAGSVGFARYSVRPARIAGLDWARGSIRTPYGTINSGYGRE